jgi:hypothetical protein
MRGGLLPVPERVNLDRGAAAEPVCLGAKNEVSDAVEE